MTATQIKNLVVKKISKIENPNLLNAINDFIESNKVKEDVYLLRNIEKKILKKSKEQIKRGEVISNEKAFNRIGKWLKEK